MSTYPKYAAVQLDGVKAGELLEWDEREEVYRAIAEFPHALRASLVAADLNAQEERRRAEDKAAEEEAAREAAEREETVTVERLGGGVDTFTRPAPAELEAELERLDRQRRADVARGIRPAILVEELGE